MSSSSYLKRRETLPLVVVVAVVAIVTSLLPRAAFCHESQKYPPGVPPHRGSEEIKFHEPRDFAQQAGHNPAAHGGGGHNPGAHGGGAPPESRVSHTHSLRGGPSDHDKEHLKSHVHEEYVDVENLSEPQMIMQHFRNYDLDKNGNIDGLEILKAANRMNEEHTVNPEDIPAIMDLVFDTDETMKAYDDNDDGLIHYGEFYRNHQKALKAAAEAAHS